MIEVSTAQRGIYGDRICGDAVAVIERPRGVLVAVADGLGHGPLAHEASETFCGYVRAHHGASLESLIVGSTTAMSSTRGAAVGLVDIDEAEGTLEYAGVGNIELRAVSRERITPVSLPGIVGTRLRRVKSFRYTVSSEDLFAVFSDGVSSRFDLEDYRSLSSREIAERILSDHGKQHDDATCVIVRVDGADVL